MNEWHDSLRLQDALQDMRDRSEKWQMKQNTSIRKFLSLTRGVAQDNTYGLNISGCRCVCNLERVDKMKDSAVVTD